MPAPEVNQAVYQQFLEEHGPDTAPEHKPRHRVINGNRIFDSGCHGCRESVISNTLRQKYGLMAVQLNDDERKLMNRKERPRVARR